MLKKSATRTSLSSNSEHTQSENPWMAQLFRFSTNARECIICAYRCCSDDIYFRTRIRLAGISSTKLLLSTSLYVRQFSFFTNKTFFFVPFSLNLKELNMQWTLQRLFEDCFELSRTRLHLYAMYVTAAFAVWVKKIPTRRTDRRRQSFFWRTYIMSNLFVGSYLTLTYQHDGLLSVIDSLNNFPTWPHSGARPHHRYSWNEWFFPSEQQQQKRSWGHRVVNMVKFCSWAWRYGFVFRRITH